MAAHARWKNEFIDDEKYHNLMRWLKSGNDFIVIMWTNGTKMLEMVNVVTE